MKQPFLRIPSNLYAEIMDYVNGCDIEISGMGQIKIIDDVPTVTAVHIVKQVCTGVETELDADALAELEFECEDGKYKHYGDLIWWWHSHVDMGVFWSTTDMTAIHQLSSHGRVIATVFNKKYQMRTAYAQNSDGFYQRVFSDDLSTEIVASAKAISNIKKFVSKPPKPVYQQHNAWHNKQAIPATPTTPKPVGLVQDKAAQHELPIYDKDTPDIPDPTEEECNIYGEEYDKWLEEIEDMTQVNTMTAVDMLDDFEETFDRLPENKLEIKKYIKNNFVIGDIR